MTDHANAATSCPSCSANNAMGAKFCGGCGAPLQGGQHIPPPPPPAPPFGSSRFSLGGAGLETPNLQWSAAMSAADAVEHATHALAGMGGRVLAQVGPGALQIEIPYKDVWTTMGIKVMYRGVLNFIGQGPSNTLLQSKLSLDWNSAVMVIALPLMCAVVAGMSNPYFFMMWLIFGAVAAALSAWMLTSSTPSKAGDRFVQALSGVAPTPAPRGQTFNMPHFNARAPQQSAPPQGAPVAPSPATAPPSPIEQLERLAKLRDAGVVTNAEFESKKADILSRL